MNYETKRNVFVNLAEDVKINDSFDEEYPKSREDIENKYKENIHNYDAALPDDLPVVPKSISEYIKSLHKFHRDLADVFGMVRDLGITRTEPTGILAWVTHNIDTFDRAWALGAWRVEETGEIVKLEEEK